MTETHVAFMPEQIADFGWLLCTYLSRGSIESLARDMLDAARMTRVADVINDHEKLAHRVAELLNEAGCFCEAAERLRSGGARNARISLDITRLLQGLPIGPRDPTQSLINTYEPFFAVSAFNDYFPRVLRAVCAVGVGTPAGGPSINEVRATGFLVGPDLVITNAHAIREFIRCEDDPVKGRVLGEQGSGDEIFFFFDYQAPPQPSVAALEGKFPWTVVKAVRENWLVHGRPELDNDGTIKCCSKEMTQDLDYVILRLQKPIGSMPPAKGGGSARGWLRLQESIDHQGERRVVVVQHPAGLPQQFDVGEFVRLDPTKTRFWYHVNAAKGSSGGVAIDRDGQTFALHNASVDERPGLEKKWQAVNQGIRIDLIAHDLKTHAGWVDPGEPGNEFPWSLTDDPMHPKPIIGRDQFRRQVRKSCSPGGPRILAVSGKDPGCGRQFSIKLLRRTLGDDIPVVILRPGELRDTTPTQFLEILRDELGLSGVPIPEPLETEAMARWRRLDGPQWLAGRLGDAATARPTRYPAWIVLDLVVAEGERLKWKDGLRDLVASLVGIHDPGQPVVDIPELRWLVLGPASDLLVQAASPECREDLSIDLSSAPDFADCMERAWMSREKKEIGDRAFLINIAKYCLSLKPKDEPIRRYLSRFVVDLLNKPDQ